MSKGRIVGFVCIICILLFLYINVRQQRMEALKRSTVDSSKMVDNSFVDHSKIPE